MSNAQPLAIYFHWPFCLAKCPYCDFNVHVRPGIDHAAWRAAYIKAIQYYAQMMPGREIVSVFFGGGTPSIMEPGTVRAVIDEIRAQWPVAEDAEITLEANPTSVEIAKFEAFRNAGVNRVSLGVQSLEDEPLKFLGRKHDSAQAIAAIKTAQDVYERFSFDLIYARPNQTLEQWRAELSRALELGAKHMSLYQLTIERSTPFFLAQAQGKFTMPDDVKGADFYMMTQEIMAEAGLPAYEVSNHAKPGEESRHNMVYWRYGDYAGIGPGAHGRLMIDGVKHATRDHSAPDIWLQDVAAKGAGHHPFEALSPQARFTEALMMGLRVAEGVPIARLEDEGECGVFDMIDEAKFDEAARQVWITQDGNILKASREGWLRLNALVPYLLK